MNPLTIAKFVGIGLVVALVAAGAFMLRHELIEKGKNYVYAQDNAARVKAQEKQIADDTQRVADLQEQARRLASQGRQIKKEIHLVQGPCANDGAGDPRLKQFNDWLLSRPPTNSGPADNRRPPETAVPKTR